MQWPILVLGVDYQSEQSLCRVSARKVSLFRLVAVEEDANLSNSVVEMDRWTLMNLTTFFTGSYSASHIVTPG
jgi:hypothetical protein